MIDYSNFLLTTQKSKIAKIMILGPKIKTSNFSYICKKTKIIDYRLEWIILH